MGIVNDIIDCYFLNWGFGVFDVCWLLLFKQNKKVRYGTKRSYVFFNITTIRVCYVFVFHFIILLASRCRFIKYSSLITIRLFYSFAAKTTLFAFRSCTQTTNPTDPAGRVTFTTALLSFNPTIQQSPS